jgi:hypothetical protein
MRTLIEEFILELFKKKDKKMTDDEVYEEVFYVGILRCIGE